MANLKTIEIYTDGACSPNPGPGGYGLIILQDGSKRVLSGGFRNTTNNRMEIMAALVGLREIQSEAGEKVTIYSDSRYLVNMYGGGYAAKWRANGWRLANKQPALNVDLWDELLQLAHGGVTFEWVRGHNEHAENEQCDALAVSARLEEDLPPDTGYEAPPPVTSEQLSLF
ncbi:MAG: ribonuclease HI [Verrucomicrobia bacterium]|jgi:ribonuclease HI|nr:ribonuclease HI [Verrucomicrobiota bacterium]